MKTIPGLAAHLKQVDVENVEHSVEKFSASAVLGSVFVEIDLPKDLNETFSLRIYGVRTQIQSRFISFNLNVNEELVSGGSFVAKNHDSDPAEVVLVLDFDETGTVRDGSGPRYKNGWKDGKMDIACLIALVFDNKTIL